MTSQSTVDVNPPKSQNTVKWTPLKEYPKILQSLSNDCNLGILSNDICKFSAMLQPRAYNYYSPIAICIWKDGSLRHNWEMAIACLRYRLRTIGYELKINFDPQSLSFAPGCKQSGVRILSVNMIDLGTYDGSVKSVIPDEAYKSMDSWPGLDILWLMAMNPRVCVNLGVSIPCMLIPGISLPGRMPKIYAVTNAAGNKAKNTVYIDSDWSNKELEWTIMPAYMGNPS